MKVQSDKGKEMYNSTVEAYLKSCKVQLFSSENNDIKCAMPEQLIRTLKSKLFRFFQYGQATRYANKLKDFVASYNESVHSAHGMRPIDISEKNSLEVYQQYGNQ